MPGWKHLRSPEPDREYVALLTYLPLKRYRTIPRFLGYARRVEAQLSDTEGIVGYSLRAKILTRDFWTLSVWKSEDTLQAFVHHGFHAGLMAVLLPDMAATRFVRWTIEGRDCPPSWDDALQR